MYHGRFAPSPTGPLHLGSFLTAVASFLDARANDGFWHLRIDDLDTARNEPEATARILKILETAGLTWDGPVLYQSQQLDKYQAALENLEQQRLLYPCTCSRKDLRKISEKGSDGHVYPGICRDRDRAVNQHHSVRVRTPPSSIGFNDRIQGYYQQNLARQVGDFVLKRRDSIFTYQLAVVVDDASQRITQVVRGIDLIESTPRQIYLQSLLSLPIPGYCHVPLVVDRDGIKLSKQTGAEAVKVSEVSRVIFKALELLNHPPPKEMQTASSQELLQWGICSWELGKLAKAENAS